MSRAVLTDLRNPSALEGLGGPAMKLFKAGFNVNALRTNDVLRKEEWVQFDQAIISPAQQIFNGVADLVGAGLTFNLANAMGTTILQWERMSDMDPAQQSMDGITRGRSDRLEFDLNSLPIFLTHKDFHLNLRTLEASRKLGQPLDTTQAQVASRLVAESSEEVLFKGSTIKFGGASVYGYTTQPNRNTGSLTAAWSSATGAQIIGDVLSMIQMAVDDRMYGPYMLYVPISYWTKLVDDYKAESDRTILERIKAIPNIRDVKPTASLSGEVVLVNMQSDTVDLVMGQQPTTVMWATEGGFQINFKVLSIIIPRLKTDYEDRSGIVHFSE